MTHAASRQSRARTQLWDGNLLLLMARQLPKKSFRSHVLANLKAHHLAAMPVL